MTMLTLSSPASLTTPPQMPTCLWLLPWPRCISKVNSDPAISSDRQANYPVNPAASNYQQSYLQGTHAFVGLALPVLTCRGAQHSSAARDALSSFRLRYVTAGSNGVRPEAGVERTVSRWQMSQNQLPHKHFLERESVASHPWGSCADSTLLS